MKYSFNVLAFLFFASLYGSLLALPAHAQMDMRSEKIATDIVIPLLVDTDNMLQKQKPWNEPRPEPLRRDQRCFALAERIDEYRNLGYLPANGKVLEWRPGDIQGYASLKPGLKINDYLVRDLMKRCREEAEFACRFSGDSASVVGAVRSMAMFRKWFGRLSPSGRDGPVLQETFKRPIGEDDMTWMKETLGHCGQYELRWSTRHEHICATTDSSWRFELEANIPIKLVPPDWMLLEDVPDMELRYESSPVDVGLTAYAPGAQRNGLLLGYSGVSANSISDTKIEKLTFRDDGSPHELTIIFSPPAIKENTFVRIPGVGSKALDYEHWREGYVGVFQSMREGDNIKISQFNTGRYPELFNFKHSGQGPALSGTENGCIPKGTSTFTLIHKPE